MLKKIAFALTACLVFSTTYSQLFTFTFSGAGTCPATQGNSVPNPSNASVTPFSRASGLSCETASNAFNTKGWSGTAFSTTQYLEVTITPNTGYSLALSSASYTTQRSSTGPATGRISHNALGSFNTSIASDYSITTNSSGTTVLFDFPDFIGIPGQSVTFRIYGWGAQDPAGTMRISNFAVNGAIVQNTGGGSANSLLSFDNTNNYVGVNQPVPAYTLDVNGKLNISDNLFAKAKVLIGNPDLANISGYALVVNGTTVVKKLVVLQNSSPWPDYVFSSGYHLRSLSSLKSYISMHNHLPDVPSADKVKEEGSDIGSNQKILLMKIEELTLYLISLNEKQEKQARQIGKLKSRIELLKKEMKNH